MGLHVFPIPDPPSHVPLHPLYLEDIFYKLFSTLELWKWKLLSGVRLFATPWTIQSMEISRTEYCSR